MPVYLVHGFRWPRAAIRIHIILQNLDDAAAEWLIAPETTKCMLSNFWELYPSMMESLPSLRFIEQHDPTDLSVKGQPYAYVADTVEEIKLGADIDEARGRLGLSEDSWIAIRELRDQLCKDEKLAWYVVVCGDEERRAPTPTSPSGPSQRLFGNGSFSNSSTIWSKDRSGSYSTGIDGSEKRISQSGDGDVKPRRRSISRSFRKVFGGKNLKKTTSLKDLKNPHAMSSNYSNFSHPAGPPPAMPPPPIPALPGTAK